MGHVKALYDRVCACGCQKRFTSYWPQKRFSSEECRTRYHNRRLCDGLKMIDAAVAWRKKRTTGSFTEMCAILDQIIAADK